MTDIAIKILQEHQMANVVRLMEETESIGHHTVYTLWQAYYFDTSYFLTASDGNKLYGYIFGRRAGDRVFLWQIAVAKNARKKGIGKKLMQAFWAQAKRDSAREIVTTIARGNTASEALIGSVAADQGASMREYGETGTFGGTMGTEVLYRLI